LGQKQALLSKPGTDHRLLDEKDKTEEGEEDAGGTERT
jgi:hypothetical protein